MNDPTYKLAAVRDLRRKGKRCRGCRYNVTEGRKHCSQGHGAWETGGPCILYADIDIMEQLRAEK